MSRRSSPPTKLMAALAFTAALLARSVPVMAQSAVTFIYFPAADDLAYSDATGRIYASKSTNSTLTPINPANGALGTPISVPGLSGRLCSSDGGRYIFAALNDATNHICQFDVESQTVVNAWPMDGTYVDDMAAILGTPGAVAVTRKVFGSTTRFAGVAVYDNGVLRTNIFAPGISGPTVIESSRSPGRLYGYDNELSPASTYILKVDASGVSQVGAWNTLQGFYVDIAWRAGWIFATSGQIFDPDRGIQVGSFVPNTPVTDDAASGRYYLVSVCSCPAGAITAYDQNTLLPVGATAAPGLIGSLGSLIRCGTNGFAARLNSDGVVLLRTPFESSGPFADLRLSVTIPPLPIPTGRMLTYTLMISNQGPSTARNVVLTQTLPANCTYASSISSSGTVSATNGGLLSSPLTIPGGGSVTVTVNLQTVKAGLLAAVASITSDSLDPNLSNNFVHLELSVGEASSRDSVTEVSLQTTDIVWDKVSGRMFASIPNSDWLLGNSVTALDPATGEFDSRITMPAEPTKLAVADNGQYLYAGLSVDPSIQRIDIFSHTPDIKFPTRFSGVADMAVFPGAPHTIAATVYDNFAVYDDGVMRPNTVGPNQYNVGSYLALSDVSSVAYEALPNELRGIAIDSSGATAAYSVGLIGFDTQIKYDAGRLYTSSGRVIDPVSRAVVTNLPYNGFVCTDSHEGKLFYLTLSGSAGTLHVVDMASFVETGRISVPNISGSVSSLTRWGLDGLAFRTTGGQVFLIRTTFATAGPPALGPVSQSNGVLSITWSAIPGRSYELQYRTNVMQGDWLILGTAITASRWTATATDGVGIDLQRFYRVVLLP